MKLLSVAAILGNKHPVKDMPMGILQMKRGGLRNRVVQFDVCQASCLALVQVIKQRWYRKPDLS